MNAVRLVGIDIIRLRLYPTPAYQIFSPVKVLIMEHSLKEMCESFPEKKVFRLSTKPLLWHMI